MDFKPVVSIIIPAYNVERYIEKAVMSALGQTLENIEVIIVDDASEDATVDVVQSLKHIDPRVTLYRNDTNRGPSFSRNLAIQHARGDWIAVLDADDWWSANRLEVLLKLASRERAHIVCDDLYLIEDGQSTPWNTYLKSRMKVLGQIDQTRVVDPVRMIKDDYGFLKPVIKREFIAQNNISYNEQLWFAEDFVFVLDCLLLDAKMVICSEAYYFYRSRCDSLTKREIHFTQKRYELLNDLAGRVPYNSSVDVLKALTDDLRKVSIALENDRVRELLEQKRFLRAANVLVLNPSLLIGYARNIKRRLVP